MVKYTERNFFSIESKMADIDKDGRLSAESPEFKVAGAYIDADGEVQIRKISYPRKFFPCLEFMIHLPAWTVTQEIGSSGDEEESEVEDEAEDGDDDGQDEEHDDNWGRHPKDKSCQVALRAHALERQTIDAKGDCEHEEA